MHLQTKVWEGFLKTLSHFNKCFEGPSKYKGKEEMIVTMLVNKFREYHEFRDKYTSYRFLETLIATFESKSPKYTSTTDTRAIAGKFYLWVYCGIVLLVDIDLEMWNRHLITIKFIFKEMSKHIDMKIEKNKDEIVSLRQHLTDCVNQPNSAFFELDLCLLKQLPIINWMKRGNDAPKKYFNEFYRKPKWNTEFPTPFLNLNGYGFKKNYGDMENIPTYNGISVQVLRESLAKSYSDELTLYKAVRKKLKIKKETISNPFLTDKFLRAKLKKATANILEPNKRSSNVEQDSVNNESEFITKSKGNNEVLSENKLEDTNDCPSDNQDKKSKNSPTSTNFPNEPQLTYKKSRKRASDSKIAESNGSNGLNAIKIKVKHDSATLTKEMEAQLNNVKFVERLDETGKVITIHLTNPKSLMALLPVYESLNLTNLNSETLNINSGNEKEVQSDKNSRSSSQLLLPPPPSDGKDYDCNTLRPGEIPLYLPINALEVPLNLNLSSFEFNAQEFLDHLFAYTYLTQAFVKMGGVYRHVFYHHESYNYDHFEIKNVE